MKQTYNVGYLQTPSVKHLANVKQALADNGLASPTTPNEMLPTAIEEGLQVYKEKGQVAENLKDNLIENGYVTEDATPQEVQEAYENTIETTIKGAASKSTTIDFLDFNYFYVTKNKKFLYGCPQDAGVHEFNIETKEHIVLSGGGKFDTFYETQNGVIFVYSSYSSGTSGIYKCENGSLINILFSDVQKDYGYYIYEVKGHTYFKINRKLYEYNFDTNVATLIYSQSTGSLNVKVIDNELYAIIYDASSYNMGYFNGQTFDTFYQQSKSFYLPGDDKIIEINGNLYGYTSGLIMKFDTINTKVVTITESVNSSSQIPFIFSDGNNNLYYNGYNQFSFLDFNSGESVILTETKGRKDALVVLKNGKIASCGSSGLVLINGNNTVILDESSAHSPGIEQIDDKVYYFHGKIFGEITNDSLTILHQLDSNLSEYIKSLIYSTFSKYIYLSLVSNNVGRFGILIYDGQEVQHINTLRAPNYSYISKEGKVYFSDKTVNPLQKDTVIAAETEEGLVQKIYLGD